MDTLESIPSIAILRASVFVYPTETCYGIGCDATNAELINRVYAIKGRSPTKPVSWIVADMKMAERYAQFTKEARSLTERFWPGPLTLVLKPTKEGQKFLFFGNTNFVALRASSHPIASKIAKKLGRPIIATSANKAENHECYSIKEVKDELLESEHIIDFIINGGTLPRNVPSSVVKVVGNKITIIRQGEITIKMSNVKTQMSKLQS